MKKDASKKAVIAEYIDRHFCEHDEIPSVRDIVDGTGIPLSTVHRYLISMREDGSLDYSGRRTARTKMMADAAPIHALQVLGTVACGPGQEEEQRFVETIRMPETLVEKGDYFALIAKGVCSLRGIRRSRKSRSRKSRTARPNWLQDSRRLRMPRSGSS